MTADLHTTAATRLRAAGERYTDNRRTVVDVLRKARRPLTIRQILEEGIDLAQSSAYRTLSVLERAGVVRRIAGSDEFARFELAEDLTAHHHHAVCFSCGTVQDLPSIPAVERSVRRAVDDAASRMGFTVQGHSLDLHGTCRACS